MLYHISATPGLSVLKPHVSTHNKAYVYAVENIVTGLLFGVRQDDFDFMIDCADGMPTIAECYPNAFESLYGGKSCSVYEVAENGFMRGMTNWSAELVSENEVAVIREERVCDIRSRLLDEEAMGNLTIRRYEDTAQYRRVVSEHIVDRLIRFNAVHTEDKRIKNHYGKLINALQSITDGHLL